MYTFLPTWPAVSRDPNDIRRFYGKTTLGFDLEFNQEGRPTILGLSDGELHVSVPFSEGRELFRALLAAHPETVFAGHNLVGADLRVLKNVGIELNLENIEDTIIKHWLVNMHLSKSSGKAALEEDQGEKRGRGFNNLWTMSSLYTDLPHWKDCRGDVCSGPCPVHDEQGYNGLDAAAPILSLPHLNRSMALRGLDKLYVLHRELAVALAEAREYGVFVDKPYVQELRLAHEKDRAALEAELPFNPKSSQQVIAYFKAKHGLKLDDNQEETIKDAVEELGGDDLAPPDLVKLLDFKQLGNGPDRWFQDQYVDPKTGYIEGYTDPNGFIHPHLAYFTSSSRLMCSSPNLQNIGKRRKSIGKAYRKAIIAPPGWYILRADYSNAENRVVLFRSGYQIDRDVDLHDYVKEISGLTEEMEISKTLGNAREAAKSIQHAGNILEGIQLKTPQELRGTRIKQEIAAGARIVFPEWTFDGKVVSFTGVNLARRVFGDASYSNRRKALEVANKYFTRFPGVRDFQKSVSLQCEKEHAVRTPHGYLLISYGDPADRMKTAQAMQQQSPVAHFIKLATLNLHRRWKREGLMRFVLSIHDEILCYVKEEIDPKTAMQWLVEDMETPSEEMPGFIIPIVTINSGPSWGRSWGEQQK